LTAEESNINGLRDKYKSLIDLQYMITHTEKDCLFTRPDFNLRGSQKSCTEILGFFKN